ncbi:TonB-dependent receptor plug domain-containing protein [Gluconobacter wancherniae]|uniref:TonB-dependent receptor plug domain-containing protein n=1 Tax=Gluconobacter wancherniae TaxID=1307955 RepID=UPI001B8C01C4|nr:TonB-dependent receptor [Gluconobacter wancherniae]MBS1095069.1 TonB-dependent receptor [Gluconobacter wancherniae]
MRLKPTLLATSIIALQLGAPNIITAAKAATTTPATHSSKKAAKKSVAQTAHTTARASLPPKHTAPRSVDGRQTDSNEQMIVTGTHAFNRRARDSTSPISVLSAATLRHSGQMNLADAIVRTDPSISVNAMGADAGALTSSIRMRGLNPNEVLVLVDGKRRHTTANIYADAGPQQGSTPVDLNMIPAGAIDHIEILRDGAAAMYGSDAIAGVVNIILKKTPHGLNMTAQTGANAYNGDGWQYQLGVDGGFGFSGDGYVHMSGQMYHTDHMVPNTTDVRTVPGNAEYGGYTIPHNSNKVISTPEETRENLSIEFGKTLTEGITGYGLITYAHRHSEAYENYRLPSVAPSLYPYGFSPLETMEENDYSAMLGIKGDNLFGFSWDLSTTYGADEADVGNKNTANPSMISSTGFSPTTVRAESYRMAQWTNNFDMRRRFNIANVVPVTLAMGAEHRLETYQIWPGEPASYTSGGTQGYAGLMPENAGKWGRDVWAGYLDGDFHPLKHWDLDFAGRFEHYTDVGNTENGKVSTRYDITSKIAVRGTISNGFRAPTLAEEHFSSLNVSPTGASGLLSTTSAAGRSLGAQNLKPERSTSVEGGIIVEPVKGWHISADVYQINIRDRISGAASVYDQPALNAIDLTGATLPVGITNADVSANYFANVGSTRTQGLDIQSDYMFHLHQYGTLTTTLALNLNRTRVGHINDNSQDQPYLNAQSIAYLTSTSPRSKIILNAYWTKANWDVNLRQTRYGETTSMLTYQDQAPAALQYSNTTWGQFKNTPVWLTDIEVGYRLDSNWHFAVGANNVFNQRPRRLPKDLNYLGSNIYDTDSSGIGIAGGYYYGRINANF